MIPINKNFVRLSLILSVLFLGQITQAQPYGMALAFSGANNYVSIPDNSAFNVTNSVTFEAWIKPCKVSGHNMILSKFWCSGSQNAYYFSIFDGKLRWQNSLSSCNTSGNIYQSNAPIILLNVWQHVAVTHSPSGVTLYLNGVAVTAAGFVNGGPSTLKISSEPLTIGTYKNLSGTQVLFYTGFMDEVRMWDYAVSAADIASRRTAPLIGNEPGLIAYYNMNGSGTGNGMNIPNNATATGTVLDGTTTGNVLTPYYGTGNYNSILGNDTTLCQGDILTLDATAPTAAYLWQDASTNPTFSVTQQGVYWVEVMIMSNCSNSDTINVTYTPSPLVNLGNDTAMCDGDSLILNVSNPNSTYLWQNNSVDSVFTVTQTGTYWVQVTTNNCVKMDTINVTFSPGPSVDLGQDTVLCFGGNVFLDASFPGASYLWQNNSTSPTLTVSQTGNYSVTVTVNNCTAVDSIEVSVIDLSSFNIGADTSVCNGEILSLNAGIPTANYLWSTGSTGSSISVSQAGVYWVEINTICGIRADTITVTYNPYPFVNLGNDTILCTGDTLLLNATYPLSNYVWQNGTTNSMYEVVHQGVYWVTINRLNCTFSDTINIGFMSSPNLNLGNDTSICDGDILNLDVTTNNATYNWQNGSSLPFFNITNSGNYWIELNSPCGIISDTISVQVNSIPFVDLGPDTSICADDIWVADVTSPNATYLWQDFSSAGTLEINSTGFYWVEKALNGCKSSDSLNVTVNPMLKVDIGADTVLCFGDVLDLNAQNFEATYVWSDNTSNPTYTVHSSGNYWVNVVNLCGDLTDTIHVEYENCDCNFFIPNTFTPNSDVLNDVFLPESNCLFSGYLLTIYDRWGRTVFETDDQTIGWDGSDNGKRLLNGVYAYVLKYNLLQKNKKTDYHTIYGNVNLIK